MSRSLLAILFLGAGCDIFVDLGDKDGDESDTSVDTDTGGSDTADTSVDTAIDTSVDTVDTSTDTAIDTSPDTAIETGDTGEPVDTGPSSALCGFEVAAWLASDESVYTDVQAALDAAPAGDTVFVCPGTWTVPLVVPTIDLTIEGYGPEISVLDGLGIARVIDVPSGVNVTIRGFTIKNGAAPGEAENGGGVNAGDATVRIEDVTFANNSAGFAGGAVYQAAGTLTVSDCWFDSNSAGYGGGGISYYGSGIATVSASTFVTNVARMGAAIQFWATAHGVVNDSVFEANDAESYGGAINFSGNTAVGTLDIVGSEFRGNLAANGAGLYLGAWDSPTVTVDASVFDGNEAAWTGGAIALNAYGGGDLLATDTVFTGNSARESGGALSFGDRSVNTALLDNCEISGNTAGFGAAFAVRVEDPGVGVLTVNGGSVDSNSALFEGGAMVLSDIAMVTVSASDWGSGVTENVPDDENGSTRWGASASFSCSGGSCR